MRGFALGFRSFNFRFLELMDQQNGRSMVSLKSPPMVMLCVLLFKLFIFRFFEQEVTEETEGLRAGAFT